MAGVSGTDPVSVPGCRMDARGTSVPESDLGQAITPCRGPGATFMVAKHAI